MSQRIFITGIGTDVGKTLCAAILVQKFGFSYWKPIQAGNDPQTDTQWMNQLVTRKDITFYPETYQLRTPASPHHAAAVDAVKIYVKDFTLPTEENLLIEGAGGLLVPLNDEGETIAELAKHLNTDVVIVSRHYLGSINHTLLTLEAAKNRGLRVAGIIFNGSENPSTERVILSTGVKFLGRINPTEEVDAAFVQREAAKDFLL